MPTNVNAPPQLLGQHIFVEVIDYDSDGSTPDTTEAINVSKTGGLADILVETVPGNNRKFKLTANGSVGQALMKFTANGVPAGNETVVTCTVNAPPPNLSRVDLAPNGVTGPFGP